MIFLVKKVKGRTKKGDSGLLGHPGLRTKISANNDAIKTRIIISEEEGIPIFSSINLEDSLRMMVLMTFQSEKKLDD